MRKLVNDFEIYTEFQKYVDEEIENSRKALELQNDSAEMYRFQGEVRVWRRLQKLREKINGR